MFDGMAGLLTHNGRRRCGHYGHFVMEQVEDGRSHQTPRLLRVVWNTCLSIRQSLQRFEASCFTVELSDQVKLEVSNIGCKRSKLWREPPRAEAAPFSTSDGAIYSANPTTRILLHANTCFRTGQERDESNLPIIPYNNVICILSMASQKAPPIQGASFLEEENIHVELTQNLLNVTQVMNRVKSPKAGAVVLFSGIHCQSSRYKIHI